MHQEWSGVTRPFVMSNGCPVPLAYDTTFTSLLSSRPLCSATPTGLLHFLCSTFWPCFPKECANSTNNKVQGSVPTRAVDCITLSNLNAFVSPTVTCRNYSAQLLLLLKSMRFYSYVVKTNNNDTVISFL